jgi:hypothetical protein
MAVSSHVPPCKQLLAAVEAGAVVVVVVTGILHNLHGHPSLVVLQDAEVAVVLAWVLFL